MNVKVDKHEDTMPSRGRQGKVFILIESIQAIEIIYMKLSLAPKADATVIYGE